MPVPLYLVGKRVEHTFLVKRPNRVRRTRTIFTGSVINIVKESQNPLFTKYKIRYDFDSLSGFGAGDESDNKDVDTDFIYDLLIDYVNGDLKVIE